MSLSNSPKLRKYKFENTLKQKMMALGREKNGYKKHLIKQHRFKLSLCTQCNRPFDRFLAEKQIENKRENAPICIPCITGIKRKTLENKLNK